MNLSRFGMNNHETLGWCLIHCKRSSEVAQTVVIGLYPAWDITEEAIAAADRFLGEDLPSALRRLVIEGKAGVERALKARRFDAG